jgi:acetyl-CoA synthetase
MLKPARTYEEACRTFRWRIPERYNLAFDVCDRQTMAGGDGHRTALIVEAPDGAVERYTFHVLRLLSNRLANVLAAKGVIAGNRVAIGFGPSVEAAVAVLAVTKMGAVAVPLPLSLGDQPIAWRLADAQVKVAVVDGALAPRLLSAAEAVPRLSAILVAGEAPGGTEELWAAMERASDSFAPALTESGDAAFVFYPADACGKPQGMVHAHRALPGNLPPVEFALGFFPQFGDILWAPGEWMSFEGLIWAVLPAWHHGVPVVVRAGAFDPEQGLGVMARHGVRVAMLAPGQAAQLAEAASRLPHPLPRALASGSDGLDAALHEQVRAVFGVTVNEVWGMPETGAVAANNALVMDLLPGSPGRAAPGITVEAVDADGRILRAGEPGKLAVALGAPGVFLGYLGEDMPGRLRLPTGWLDTGRRGIRDLDGYLWPEPQALPDNTVMVDGARVCLDEVQAALKFHPAVAEAGIAFQNGQLRACVVPAAGRSGDPHLAAELKDWLAGRRCLPEVPRRIDFAETLPVDEDGGLTEPPIRLEAPSRDERW